MMAEDPRELSDYSANRLGLTWSRTKEHWRDSGRAHFAQHHWLPLQHDIDAYQSALKELLETLNAAEQATEY